MKLSKFVVAASLTALLTGPVLATDDTIKLEDGPRLKSGTLTCLGDGGWGLIIGSRKNFHCTYAPFDESPVGA